MIEHYHVTRGGVVDMLRSAQPMVMRAAVRITDIRIPVKQIITVQLTASKTIH